MGVHGEIVGRGRTVYNHRIWVIHVRNVIKPIHAFVCADKIVSINNF